MVLRVPFLQARRVLPEHVAQVAGGVLGVNGAAEALLDQERQAARVVQVRVAQDHGVDPRGIEWEWLAVALLLLAATLDQAAVEQDPMGPDLQHVAGTGDATRGAVEFDLHLLPCTRPGCLTRSA